MRKILLPLLLLTTTASAADLPAACAQCAYRSVVQDEAMDYETCAEIAGDIAEHAKMEPGYRVASEHYRDRRRDARVLVVHTDGRPSGEILCRSGRITVIEWRPGR